jgi:hypothetical protein
MLLRDRAPLLSERPPGPGGVPWDTRTGTGAGPCLQLLGRLLPDWLLLALLLPGWL